MMQAKRFSLVSLINSISTFMGYLMPKQKGKKQNSSLMPFQARQQKFVNKFLIVFKMSLALNHSLLLCKFYPLSFRSNCHKIIPQKNK